MTPDQILSAVRTRLDEIEKVARQATPGPWRWVHTAGKAKFSLVGPGYLEHQVVVPSASGDVYPSVFDATHITAHDPQSVLTRVAADRELLAEYEGMAAQFTGHPMDVEVSGLWIALRLLARGLGINVDEE